MRARPYTDEVRSEAVRLVVERRLSATEAAMQLGLRSEVVRVWVRRFRCSKDRPGDIELLRARVKHLAMERDTLAILATNLLQKTG